jgi:hypothetical protein
MAGRSLTPAALAELLKDGHAPAFLVTLYLDDGTIGLTDAWTGITWNGQDYRPQGHFISFSGLEENAEPVIPTIMLTLSAVDQSWIAIALGKPTLDRRLTIHKAFLDYAHAVITSPCMIFDGRLDALDILDAPQSGTCTLSASASSQWADFTRTPGRHTNAAEQQTWFAGDLGLAYAASTNVTIKWGGA